MSRAPFDGLRANGVKRKEYAPGLHPKILPCKRRIEKARSPGDMIAKKKTPPER